LEETVDIVEIFTTNVVIDELLEMKKYGDIGAEMAGKALNTINEGKIQPVDVEEKYYSKYRSKKVDSGEASCFSLCLKEKIPIFITDDVEAAYHLDGIAKVNDIEIKICVSILVELVKTGRISLQEAREKMDRLIKMRGWEGGVLEVLAKKYLV
jgi:predicted nucleic acid-binding protein